MSTVEIWTNRGWAPFGSFHQATDAVRLLPAIARHAGTRARCTTDGTIIGADIPRGVSSKPEDGAPGNTTHFIAQP